ncbi:helix-turn-helix domain-containing protein [Anaerocolumna sedimenticola]|uniref:Helix-turn-helix domain-containing protein n=1 Tax=Anaerocolumna sedimenticola TaxID=2696063 RepID=A0A6P1TVA9_9FIRM|nr:AraC family transcriptional regulator [Anaerocolumna sedimenticola]QHQ63418.1 helix-turn-helix domain-containing protein [Anaerocolumna sedimenticola]
MNWLDGFNQVIEYIEKNLEGEIDYEKITAVFGYSVYHVQRLFAMIAGVPLSEYIRNRRLSKAAVELQGGEDKVIDVAVKYGYSSPNSFNRAFKALHGVSPSDVKKDGVSIKAYPPLFFELTVKGAQAMDYRIEKKNSFRIAGVKLHTTMENGECYRSTPEFWHDLMKDGGQNDIMALMNEEPAGLLGVSNYCIDFSTSEFDYYIACASNKPVPDGMSEFTVPASTWAIFTCTEKEADAVQKLEQRIVMEWLPTSGYQFAYAPDIELYSEEVWEVWIPVTK